MVDAVKQQLSAGKTLADIAKGVDQDMLPLRFIAKNLGHSVNWDNSAKTITIQ